MYILCIFIYFGFFVSIYLETISNFRDVVTSNSFSNGIFIYSLA